MTDVCRQGHEGLRVLHLEDSALDADLIAAVLAKGGVEAKIRRVMTRDEYEAALRDDPPDLILADLSLPDFDGHSALVLAGQKCPDVPFIFVSGVMGEEAAIDSLLRGATDYVLKRRLERLAPAVRRALAEARERAERREAEAALRRSEEAHRKLAERLAEADQHKDEFLAMLAHELRNPLAPIRNALGLLRLSVSDAEAVGRACELMDRQVSHLVRLVDDLLDVSRIQRGKIKLHAERLDLSAAVRQAVETSRPLLDARGHALEVALPGGPVAVDGDMVRLTQVVANLLNNAAKYTPDGGRVRVALAEEGGEAVLCVGDDGQGIAPELLPRLFELFVQGDRSLDRSEGGLGIGLTLVKRLVEMHGGSVEARSDGPGKGSEFVVRLPCGEAAPEPAAADAAQVRLVGAPRRVLVVDDNRDAADTLAALLSLSGHEVRLAYDGPGALKAASEYRPEAVLLDLGLPGMNGHEVARALRGTPGLDQVLLIALTGYGRDDDRERSRRSGFAHHVVKPADPDHLERLLAAELPRRPPS